MTANLKILNLFANLNVDSIFYYIFVAYLNFTDMKKKHFYLVHRKNYGCYPFVFTSVAKAEIFAKHMRDTSIDFDVVFTVIPCIPDFTGSVGAVSFIRKMYNHD